MCVCLCHCQHVTPRARGCHYQKLSPTLKYIIIWQLLQDNLPEISFHNHPSEKGSIHTGHNLAFDTENLTSMLQHCKNIRFHFFINLRRDAVLSLDLAIFHSGRNGLLQKITDKIFKKAKEEIKEVEQSQNGLKMSGHFHHPDSPPK